MKQKCQALGRAFFAALIFVAFLPAATTIAAADDSSAPPELHVLLKDQTDLHFRLSPDGSRVVRVQWFPTGYFIMVHNTLTGEIETEIPLGDKPPMSLDWLNDRRLLFAADGNIVAVNIDGTDRSALLSTLDADRGKNFRSNLRVWAVKHLLPDDPEHILAQSWNLKKQPAIVKANIYTGKEEQVVFEPRLDIETWAIDRDGDVRLGVRYKKDEIQFLARDPASGKWAVYDDYIQDGENTLGFTGKTFLTKRISLEEFDYDDDHLFMATNVDSDRYKIVKYRVSEKRVVEDVYASETFDVGGDEQSSTSLLFHDQEQALVGIRFAEERIRTVWFDEKFQAYQDRLDGYRPEHDNIILDWNDDATVLLVLSRSDVDPGRYSILHNDENKLVTFSIVNEELDQAALSKTEVVNFDARDGYRLNGYLNLATTDDTNDGQLIMLPHGGPWARDHWGYEPIVQYFATRGYNVLRVNFRGSTGYGRAHLLAGLRNIDSLMIDDIADAARWAITEGHASPDSVFIFGHSYGGYAALMSTIRYPDLYQAAVAWSAPLDLVAQIRKYKKEDEYFAYEYWRTAVGDPRREKDTLQRISPMFNIDKLRAPFIVFHGANDETIPAEQAEDFEEALRKSGNNAEVHVIDKEGHTFRNNNNISYILEKSIRFFSDNRDTNSI